MGFFQQQRVGALQPGDVLILEYALNDLNHLAQKGYRASDLLRSVELILRNCGQQGVRVLPVIMRPLAYERLESAPRLHVALRRIFEHYGLHDLDVSAVARERLGVARLSSAHYEDVNHYRADGDVVRLIADELLGRLAGCTVPRLPAAALHCGAGQALEIVTELRGGTRSSFANSAGQAVYHRPDDTPVVATAGKEAILVGMVVLAGTTAGVLRVESGSRSFLLSLRHDHKRFDKPAIKLISLDNLLDAPLRLAAGDRVTISWSDTPEGALVDLGFRQPATTASATREGGIVGLILETGARPVATDAVDDVPEVAPRRARNGDPRKRFRVKGVDGRTASRVTQQKVESRKVRTMTTPETSAGRKANTPMDAEGFFNLLDTVERFTTAVQRTLRQVAPKVTLQQYLALRTLAGRDADAAKTRKVKAATVKRLVALGYMAEKADGDEHEITAAGTKLLEDVAALIDTVAAKLAEGERPVTSAASRPLARVTTGLRKLKPAAAA